MTEETTPTPSSQAATPGHRQKRPRVSVACDECRLRRSKCDGSRPACGSCESNRVQCMYEVPKPKANVTKEYVDGLHDKIKMLESRLQTITTADTLWSMATPQTPLDRTTYEWNEADERELGVDAMGAAKSQDYNPGFFGGSSTLAFMESIKHISPPGTP